MLIEQEFTIAVGKRELRGIFTAPRAPGPYPSVVVCHGFKGFMEWGFFPFLAELLAYRGFCTVRFNFSGGGMRPGDELVTDLEAFRRATFSQDVRELKAVISALGETIAPRHASRRDVGLFGHSRGGGIALLAASADSSVRALVTWAAVAHFNRLSAAENDRWRSAGEIAIVNSRTGQELAVGAEVLDDLETHAAALDLEAAANLLRAPWLLLHGEDDETVPLEEAQRLRQAASGVVELRTLHDTDHTFGTRHPFSSPNPSLIQAMNLTQAWFRQRLGRQDREY